MKSSLGSGSAGAWRTPWGRKVAIPASDTDPTVRPTSKNDANRCGIALVVVRALECFGWGLCVLWERWCGSRLSRCALVTEAEGDDRHLVPARRDLPDRFLCVSVWKMHCPVAVAWTSGSRGFASALRRAPSGNLLTRLWPPPAPVTALDRLIRPVLATKNCSASSLRRAPASPRAHGPAAGRLRHAPSGGGRVERPEPLMKSSRAA